jgi:hypothetical protein
MIMGSHTRGVTIPGPVALTAALALAVSVALAADPTPVRVDGRVQWIAGAKMLLIPDGGGVPVNIDLGQVPQEQYANLRQGASVSVAGVFSTDGRRMMATAVMAAGEREERVDGQPVAIPTPTRP